MSESHHIPLPGDWTDDAVCHGLTNTFFARGKSSHMDPDVMDTPGRKRKMRTYKPRYFDEAKALCITCPVREQCLNYALKYKIRTGVWGGLDWLERDLINGYLPTGKRFE